MYCGKCGSSVPDGNSFCSNCGAPISQKTTQVNVNAYSQQVPPPVQAPQQRSSVGRVFEAILIIAFAIVIMIIVMRACTSGMYQMGLM